LHLSGVIVDGKRGTGGSIVSGPMVSAIQSLADDDKVKGVVVRVNSPGGSATASESIRQALKSLADKKPTVVSMGSTAASGGYWVSCIGVPIYAEKATITGSIGVFSMKLSFGTLLRRVGVNVETIALDDSAAAYSMDHAWTDEDESTIKKSIDMVYGKFLELVGDSRNLPIEKVHPLAGGRVWAGTQAKAIGLVDEIGGVDDCLAVVAKKAELDDYQVIHRPSQSTGISLLELLGEGDENEIFSGLSKTAVQSLANRGLSLSVTKLLLEDGVNRASGMPTIWLLNPAEISVK
jgi:protease-4